MGTGSFPGLKQPGRGLDNPTVSKAAVKETDFQEPGNGMGKTRSFVICTTEVKAVFVHALKAYEGSGGIAPCKTRTKVNAQPHRPTTSPPRKDS